MQLRGSYVDSYKLKVYSVISILINDYKTYYPFSLSLPHSLPFPFSIYIFISILVFLKPVKSKLT